ncbi:MAG: hypothetical protein K9M55_05600 [Candidatus Marinimicrobia bacterium]|nr:hypothetical protein [Candidatus Neomarinimicrobiota bacterium]MCF7922157.1 hypothetical protein [Candidatus Neomarinimicrobiota bacterium]
MKQRYHHRISVALQIILLVGLVGSVWRQHWDTAITTSAIILLTLTPLVLKRRLGVFIPPEFELMSIAFIFAALFLGEVQGYYTRYWWWDIALHTSSGGLLGIIGFLLVHILNEEENIDIHMKPGFVAFFAFLFAVGLGAIWEIFEFSMDQFFDFNMQKAMLNDPSGLTDTMWDLIVDTLGAIVIAIMGYSYLKKAGNTSFLEHWIDQFIETNPRFFKQR